MFALIALLLLGSPQSHALPVENLIKIDNLGIKATEHIKWYSYTNKEAGFYFGEVHGMNSASYQGWTVYDNPVLKDYSVNVNGKVLGRGDSKVTVFPDRLVRQYADGVTETFSLLDSVNAFLVQLKASRPSAFDFTPLYNASNTKDLPTISGKVTSIENRNVPDGTYGRWISVAGYKLGIKNSEMKVGGLISCAVFSTKGREVSFVVACGKTRIDAEQTAIYVLKKQDGLLSNRKERMQEILNGSEFMSDNSALDSALAWAKLSIDALVTHQGMRGIWAGLPWFNNYWGRDSFISLPGTTLWEGDFPAAKQVLLDFAAKQDTDTASTNYGRIPNLITPKETIYNTADGTPWFVHSVFMYFSMTGDRQFLFNMFPSVKRALEGTIKYHMDENLFLTHGDQETWMDAAGPNGPYTPRGNRAIDVQSFWLRQILETRFLSTFVGDDHVEKYTTEIAKRFIRNFNDMFIENSGDYLYDHLNADGTGDTTLRPNQLFALWMVTNPETRSGILKNVVEKLAYPWGVSSLSQDDSNFHPFHHNEPYYVPDAAYHNGTVWLWLTGQLVSDLTSMVEQDFAFKSTMFLANEILDGKTAGTLPELFDAFPREGNVKPDESGAFSQAWSLAEFINSIYQDYLGVQLDIPHNSIILNPRLPSSVHKVSFKLNGGSSNHCLIKYNFENDQKEIEIDPTDSLPGVNFSIFIMFGKEQQMRTAFYLRGRDRIMLKMLPDTVIAEKNGEPFSVDHLRAVIPHTISLDSLHFQTPQVNLNWNFRKQPDFRILKSGEIKQNPAKTKSFASAEDPIGDDKGPSGNYSYPLNQNFQPGILDITRADVSYDSSDVYFCLKFRKLVNPMWHPEYGFQLTFAAIAIGDGAGGQRAVDRNSNYTLPEGRGFQKIIYVGGGLEVFDNTGRKLAAYIPSSSDTTTLFGDVKNSEISFSLPVSLIGKPDDNWKISILVGAQDDHGGGGVGEFRAVGPKATEWQGGGRENDSMPNIYDELILR